MLNRNCVLSAGVAVSNFPRGYNFISHFFLEKIFKIFYNCEGVLKDLNLCSGGFSWNGILKRSRLLGRSSA